jgi:hypothetical protein
MGDRLRLGPQVSGYPSALLFTQSIFNRAYLKTNLFNAFVLASAAKQLPLFSRNNQCDCLAALARADIFSSA